MAQAKARKATGLPPRPKSKREVMAGLDAPTSKRRGLASRSSTAESSSSGKKAKREPAGPAQVRTFEGEPYQFLTTYERNADANRAAKRARDAGMLVRVVGDRGQWHLYTLAQPEELGELEEQTSAKANGRKKPAGTKANGRKKPTSPRTKAAADPGAIPERPSGRDCLVRTYWRSCGRLPPRDRNGKWTSEK